MRRLAGRRCGGRRALGSVQMHRARRRAGGAGVGPRGGESTGGGAGAQVHEGVRR